MPRKSEQTLAGWTSKASDTEDARYQWTKAEIAKALAGTSFDGNNYDLYAKGSYPNHTNVVRDSDVDVAVELTSITGHEFIHGGAGFGLRDVGFVPYEGSYSLRAFKDDVYATLVGHFGSAGVTRGDKAIHLKESYRGLQADVVVCQTFISHTGRTTSMEGIRIFPDDGGEIHNYPRQHLDRGVEKNDRTQRRYKRTVRILKRLENEMVANGTVEAFPSFLIESLVWNAPASVFNDTYTWTDRVDKTLRLIRDSYKQRDEWLEANGIKYLFHPEQRWTEAEADKFASAALRYLELD